MVEESKDRDILIGKVGNRSVQIPDEIKMKRR